jgi:hypothetical protein
MLLFRRFSYVAGSLRSITHEQLALCKTGKELEDVILNSTKVQWKDSRALMTGFLRVRDPVAALKLVELSSGVCDMTCFF